MSKVVFFFLGGGLLGGNKQAEAGRQKLLGGFDV